MGDAPLVALRFPGVAEAGDTLPADWLELVPWLAHAVETRNLTALDALARVLTGETVASKAAPMQEPGPDVETNLTLRFPTLTTLTLEGTLDVRRHEVNGVHLDAARLREGWSLAQALGEPMARAFVADLESQVRDALLATLHDAFPDAQSVEVTRVALDVDSLDAARGLDAPVRVAAAARVERPADLEASEEAAAALLDGGARVRVDVPFATPAAHRQSFTLLAPAGFAFDAPTAGSLADEGRTLRILLDNTYGFAPLRDVLGVVVHHPLATAPTAEDLEARIDVRLRALDPAVDEVRYLVRVEAEASALDVASRFPGQLPGHVALDVLGADTLRRLHGAGLVDDAALAEHERAASDQLRAWLEKNVGPVAEVAGGFDREDLTRPTAPRFDVGPAIPFHGGILGAYALPEGTAARLDLALSLGGRISFELPLPPPPVGRATYTLHPPEGLAFADVEGGELQTDGAATFVASDDDDAAPVVARFTLVDPHAASPDATDARVDVLVDVRDVALDPLGGSPPTLLMRATLRASIDSFELPDEARDLVDPRVQLTHLSSDGIRLLRGAGLLDDENLTRLETLLLDAARERMDALGVAGAIHGGLVRETLLADATGPIVVEAHADFARPLNVAMPGPQGSPAATIALYRTTQRLSFPGLDGVDAVYTVLLPQGIDVLDVKGAGERIQQEGRDGFVVRPNGGNADVDVQLAVTPTFLALKAWPLLVAAGALLALMVGLIARRGGPRRRARD